MSELARHIAALRKPPKSDPEKPTPARVTRQRRDRLNRDAEYLVLRDIYLEQNPICDFPGCDMPAKQVHHVVRGTAGKARSLLNTNTFLGACTEYHHDLLEKLPWEYQLLIKQKAIADTIERLRR